MTSKKFDAKVLKSLFSEYAGSSDKRAAADAASAAAARAQSDVVRRILDLTGSKGPYTVGDSRMVAMVRPSEKEAAKLTAAGKPVPERTYFFRAESGESIEV